MEHTRTPGADPDATEAPGGGVQQAQGLEPGARVGRYVVGEPIGAGGMGFVVSALDPKLDRPVAIKVLHRADDKGVDWLRREAQALARLNHPSIVVIHDVGIIDGRPFIAMERLDGVTLSEWLGAAPRSESDILTVFRAAGRGLAVAHEAGIVHCDFKPGNVMICGGVVSGRGLAESVKIMDFGLARESGEGSVAEGTVAADTSFAESVLSQDLTDAGRLRGTPKYMAAEQFALAKVGPPADQFAFCLSLYEALWSRSPFPGDTVAARLAEQMCGADPLAPPARRSQRRLSNAVLRGLDPLAENRWPSMDALVECLEPRSRGRWWMAAGTGTAVLAGILWTQSAKDPCEHAGARIDSLWNDTARDGVEAAFERSGRSYASSTWSLGERRMDEWSARWATTSRDNCRATHSEATQTDAEFDVRSFCLLRQLHRFETVTDVLLGVDADGVGRALDTIATLPDPGECGMDGELVRPATDANTAAKQEAAYAAFERCEVLASTAGAAASLECAKEALEVAQAAGDTNVLLDARAHHAAALGASGESSEAWALNEQLYFDAKAADRGSLAAKLALRLAMARLRKDTQRARKWLRHAESIRGTSAGRSKYARVEGLICAAEGNIELAVERGREAVAQAEASGNPKLLGRALNSLGKVLNDHNRTAEARPVYERALRVQTEARGEIHRSVATSLNNLATVLAMSGELEASLVMSQRALAIRRLMLPKTHRHIATGASNVAETLARLGRHRDALVLHREAAEVFAIAEGPDSWYHGALRTRVAADLRNLGRLEEARASLDVALKMFREHPLEHHERFAAETELALLEEAAGNLGVAIGFFESVQDAPLRASDRRDAKEHLERLRRASSR